MLLVLLLLLNDHIALVVSFSKRSYFSTPIFHLRLGILLRWFHFIWHIEPFCYCRKESVYFLTVSIQIVFNANLLNSVIPLLSCDGHLNGCREEAAIKR